MGPGGWRLDLGELATVREFDQRFAAARRQRWQAWQATAASWADDPRLVAYFPIHSQFDMSQRMVPSLGRTAGLANALAVGPVGSSQGRFGEFTSALSFERAGARLRTRIDGELSALTLSCWVRIDSLQNRYNALFMADGYENGEPHWQIRDDGRIMFSVMVDDSQVVEFFNERDRRVVRDAGLHRIYLTPPVWNPDDSGQWMHLAAVYDPNQRRVRQYVNGAMVADEEIPPRLLVRTLRIGAAEIGNWGQPFRQTPWFAVRNLDGAIDEMWVLDAALESAEIQRLYEQGKPLGF
ncbi:MAG: LamG domain-containing protein [Planctomycetota bacterium]|nr:MAG: LamG domain-containing protein [Planctomycetota bacterium]